MGIINNYFYGKAGKADYTPEQMPTTRVKLFFEMLRIHFAGLMGMNLFYLLFCLPALIWSLFNFELMQALSSLPSAPETLQQISDHWFIYLVGMIPCLGLCGIGAPGLMYVMRNWARDQHAFGLSDFRDNVKANWKQGLVIGLINGVSLFIGYVSYRFYGQLAATQTMFFVVPQMLVVTVCVLWWMINMQIYTMMVTYDMKLSQLIRNSAIIAIARLPWSLLFLLGSVLLPVLAFVMISHIYLILGTALVYLVIGFALTGLVYASFANSCFDRFLNPKIEGAPVNMGLRDPSLDDDLDDVEDPNPIA